MPHRGASGSPSSSHRIRVGVVWEIGTIWLIGLIVLIGLTLFTFSRLQQAETDSSLRERYRVVLFDLRENLQTNISLGFELADNPTAQARLEELLTRDASFQVVEIYDNEDVSLFSTDRGSVGEKIQDTWRSARQKNPNGWTVQGERETVIGIPIRNAFDEIAGYLALTYVNPDSGRSDSQHLLLVIFVISAIGFATLSLFLIGRSYVAEDRAYDFMPATALTGSQKSAALLIFEADQRLDHALGQLSEDARGEN